MKKKITETTQIKFWKDNLISGEYTLSAKEVEEKFVEYIKAKEVAWLERYGSDGFFRAFVGQKEGLSSVMELDMYEPMVVFLKDAFWTTVESMKKPTSQKGN